LRHAYDVAQIRAAEAALMARLPEGTLMQRAASGLAATCAALLNHVYGARVALLVGSGDNGGDTLYAGARLARRGARVDALLLSPDKAHAAGLAAFRRAGGRVVGDPAVLDGADLMLDGIVGIGGRGGLRPDAAALAARAAASKATVVAVDVPSGVDASTGRVTDSAVRAHLTVTFGAYKIGLLVDPGAEFAGVVHLIDIGLGEDLPSPPVTALQADDVAGLLPVPAADTDKYRRGVVGVCAGSQAYTGAAVLTVGGALYGGAGYVRFSSTPAAVAAVRSRWPEAVLTEGGPGKAGRVQAWVAGPGMGTDENAWDRLEEILDSDVPVLVDADGLRLLADELAGAPLDRDAPTLLTPHAGEAARLLGIDRALVEAERIEHAQRVADAYGVTVLLKGRTTVIADRGGAVRVNSTGTPWLGTAGTGDVLSGVCGSLLASGLSALDAASIGAYLHGLAGRLAADDAPIGAYDVIAALPDAWRAVARDAP